MYACALAQEGQAKRYMMPPYHVQMGSRFIRQSLIYEEYRLVSLQCQGFLDEQRHAQRTSPQFHGYLVRATFQNGVFPRSERHLAVLAKMSSSVIERRAVR